MADTSCDAQVVAVADRLNGDAIWALFEGLLTVTPASAGTATETISEETIEKMRRDFMKFLCDCRYVFGAAPRALTSDEGARILFSCGRADLRGKSRIAPGSNYSATSYRNFGDCSGVLLPPNGDSGQITRIEMRCNPAEVDHLSSSAGDPSHQNPKTGHRQLMERSQESFHISPAATIFFLGFFKKRLAVQASL